MVAAVGADDVNGLVGQELDAFDLSDDDARELHRGAFLQAGHVAEVNRGLVSILAQRVVAQHVPDDEQRDDRDDRENTDAKLRGHVSAAPASHYNGIGPISLPCKNCCMIGFCERRKSFAGPLAMIVPSNSIAMLSKSRRPTAYRA